MFPFTRSLKKLKSILAILFVSIYPSFALADECVILLHGLARTASSMSKLETRLVENGYYVSNIGYPSRKMPIEDLAELAVNAGLEKCTGENASPVNFVTHSLGGILVRQFYLQRPPENVKRVVMLGPPNNGSEVVDSLKNTPGYELLNGPAGMQLGTGSHSVPRNLGPVNFELGVIAGTHSINFLLSTFLPGPDDGKVSVESTKVEGMCGFVALPTSHPFMMRNNNVIGEVISFLKTGTFGSKSAITSACGE